MKRLVKHDKRHKSGYQLPCGYSNYYKDVFIKLGQFEDLMEKYEIESVEELETIIMLSFVLQGAFGFKDDEVE